MNPNWAPAGATRSQRQKQGLGFWNLKQSFSVALWWTLSLPPQAVFNQLFFYIWLSCPGILIILLSLREGATILAWCYEHRRCLMKAVLFISHLLIEIVWQQCGGFTWEDGAKEQPLTRRSLLPKLFPIIGWGEGLGNQAASQSIWYFLGTSLVWLCPLN